MALQLIQISYGTPEYDDSLQLRTEVLRKPLNLEFKVEDLVEEFDQLHFGLYDGNHNLLACFIFKAINTTTLKMRQVAVSPLFQNQGLGKIMVGLAEKWSKFQGYQKIVLAARDVAVNFYLSMNYVIEGEKFVEVGIPHRSMFKII